MLAIVGCDCHNGITLSQGVLSRAGVPDWLSIPTFRGKSKAYEFLESFGDIDSIDGISMLDFLRENSSYSIIVGYNDEYATWVNVGRGDLRSKTLAKRIISLFA